MLKLSVPFFLTRNFQTNNKNLFADPNFIFGYKMLPVRFAKNYFQQNSLFNILLKILNSELKKYYHLTQ